MPVNRMCKDCNRSIIIWSTAQTRCPKCQQARSKAKPPKPIKKKGKRTLEYEKWRDTIARPYLIKTFGEICATCKGSRCNNEQLDVDHKKNRGSHPELKMELSNVQLLGRFPCHFEKTNGIPARGLDYHTGNN